MVSEFELNLNTGFANADLQIEMAHINEWVVRDPLAPDELLLVYVTPSSDGYHIATACSCFKGASDVACDHARDVVRTLKAQDHLVTELFRKKDDVAA